MIFLYNEYKELIYIFNSVAELSRLIHSNHTTINKHIKTGDLFRGSWYITKLLFNNDELLLITDKNSPAFDDLIKSMIDSAFIKKAVFVYDSDMNLLNKYIGVMEAEADLKISHSTIKKYVKLNKIIMINIDLVSII